MIVNPLDSFGISPGAKIIAMGNYRIEIAGVLICNGTEKKPITFTPTDETTAYNNLGATGYWGGFLIDSRLLMLAITYIYTYQLYGWPRRQWLVPRQVLMWKALRLIITGHK